MSVLLLLSLARPVSALDEVAAAVAAALVEPRSEFAPVVIRFQADRAALRRRHPVANSPQREQALAEQLEAWLAAVEAIDYDALSDEAALEWHLLRTALAREAYRAREERRERDEARLLIPFLDEGAALAARRAEMPPPDARTIAEELDRLAASADAAAATLRAAFALPHDDAARPSAARARLAWRATVALASDLRAMVAFRDGYDPMFTWWTARPAAAAGAALDRLAALLRADGMGVTPEQPDAIVGTPIGAEALAEELLLEWIPYTAAELIEIADREFAWCEAELTKAAAEMGFGRWQDALEAIKRDHVDPGEQPALVHELALEAIAFLRERDLVTVPRHAEETWRMAMMSPERQRITPFFTGGETVTIAFPTASMEHADKLMSLRGNNRAFARAVVHHELIPGHHLQQWALARHRPHRALFATPFWLEGWALHWEMLLWDRGFATTPQERIGMLWWRAHRAARIQFSLRFHLGEWSADRCIEYLVERLAHERANAEGEARRSFSGDYPPLYQIAYMVGGLQMRALHHELVGSGAMSEREFHDEVLRQHSIPIEALRVALRGERLPRDARPSWRFDEQLPPR
jgi:hypothetical protein